MESKDQLADSWIRMFVIVVVAVNLGGCRQQFRSISLASSSPSGKYRVELHEHERRDFVKDRNFDVMLFEKGHSPNPTIVFTSSDEGRLIGTEKVVWSTDETSFVLIGKEFSTVIEASISQRYSLYLYYNLLNKELKCNSSQADHTRFALDDLVGYPTVK